MRTYQQGDQVFIDYEAYKVWYEAAHADPFDLHPFALVYATGDVPFEHDGELVLRCYWANPLGQGSTNTSIPMRFILPTVFLVGALIYGRSRVLGVFTDPVLAEHELKRYADVVGATTPASTDLYRAFHIGAALGGKQVDAWIDEMPVDQAGGVDKAIRSAELDKEAKTK